MVTNPFEHWNTSPDSSDPVPGPGRGVGSTTMGVLGDVSLDYESQPLTSIMFLDAGGVGSSFCTGVIGQIKPGQISTKKVHTFGV